MKKIKVSAFKVYTNFLKKILYQQDLNPGLISNHVIFILLLHNAPRGRTTSASFLRMTKAEEPLLFFWGELTWGWGGGIEFFPEIASEGTTK